MPGAASELAQGAGALSSSPSPVASERVERPEPGLARGSWEAPQAAFYGVAAAALIGGITVAIRSLRRTRR